VGVVIVAAVRRRRRDQGRGQPSTLTDHDLTGQLGHHVAKLGEGPTPLRRRPVPTQDPPVDDLIASDEQALVFQSVQ
jgi:hypothetical protein